MTALLRALASVWLLLDPLTRELRKQRLADEWGQR